MLDSIPQEGQKLVPINTHSAMEWNGLHPQKFSGSRRHIRPQDQLNGYEGAPLPLLGRKHFESKFSAVGEYKPHIKVFPSVSNKTTDLSNLTIGGLKKIPYVPPQRKARPEKLHLYAKKSGHFEDKLNGIKTFELANQRTNNQYELEKQLQTKTRVEGLPQMRNQLDVRSLGDKAYRHPEYSSDFYKQGGLIPGATIQDKRQKVVSEKQLQSVRVPGKLTWKEREKIEEMNEDKRQVDELDFWEQNILREANPNWKDPEKFFENEDNQNSTLNQKGKVDNKKAPPAKKK
ncbi:hypothetical protein ABPG72_010744 [Tetrahymena utriculariae]